jgi:hypothetical protein
MIKKIPLPEVPMRKVIGKKSTRMEWFYSSKLRSMPDKSINALDDYLSNTPAQELQEQMYKFEPISNLIKDFEKNIISDLKLQVKRSKILRAAQKKIKQAHQAAQAKFAKEQEERIRKQQEADKRVRDQVQSGNIFTQLKLTPEQKLILKKMVDGQ